MVGSRAAWVTLGRPFCLGVAVSPAGWRSRARRGDEHAQSLGLAAAETAAHSARRDYEALAGGWSLQTTRLPAPDSPRRGQETMACNL